MSIEDSAGHAAESVKNGAHHAAHGIKGVLGKKIGPLPVGAWVVGLGGGLVVAAYVRGRSGGNDTAPEAVDAVDDTGWDTPDPGGANHGVGGGGSSAGGDGSYPESGGDDAGDPKHGHVYLAKHATTNAGWKRHTIAAMTNRGYANAVLSETLTRYLAGKPLTAAQSGVLTACLATCGTPPNPPKPAPPGSGQGHGGGHGGGHQPPNQHDNGHGVGGGHGGGHGNGHGGNGNGNGNGHGNGHGGNGDGPKTGGPKHPQPITGNPGPRFGWSVPSLPGSAPLGPKKKPQTTKKK